jgi:hypothetical protein
MWLSAIKLAVSAGSHIYKNKQQTKMLMSDAAMKHAQKMSNGELEYSGKLLEARQSDWKDEFILVLLSIPIVMLGWSVWSDNPVHMEKMELFFTTLWKFTVLVPNNFCWGNCICLWT